MALHPAAARLKCLAMSTPRIAAMASRDKVLGIVVIPHAVHMVSLQSAFGAGYLPGDRRPAPVAGVLARADAVKQNKPMDQHKATTAGYRASCSGGHEIPVRIHVDGTAILPNRSIGPQIANPRFAHQVCRAVAIARPVGLAVTRSTTVIYAADVTLNPGRHAYDCSATGRRR